MQIEPPISPQRKNIIRSHPTSEAWKPKGKHFQNHLLINIHRREEQRHQQPGVDKWENHQVGVSNAHKSVILVISLLD
jgi:hypothetical protein